MRPPVFEVVQSLRAEAASDWLMGQMFAQNLIPTAGNVAVAGTTATFSKFMEGEDFRNPWRTVLNYLWNGNPTTSWNPATHRVQAGGNTYEHDIGLRFGQFLRDPASFGGQGCISMGTVPGISYNGPNTIAWYYNPATKAPSGATDPMNFALNWFQGTGAPSAIITQDWDLMGDMFRQAAIEWDGTPGYLTSVPVYFHGFFRWLGMDILSGNHLNPCDLVPPGSDPPSNMKIYKSVNRTTAFVGDTITYWLNYRNYASVTAQGVSISDTLPSELGFVSSTPAPSSAPAVGSSGDCYLEYVRCAGTAEPELQRDHGQLSTSGGPDYCFEWSFLQSGDCFDI